MKKIVIFLGVMILFTYGHAFAYMIDGNLGDWGVTPFINWNANGPTVDKIVLDNIRQDIYSIPWGGERYDVEALYFDNDADFFYFAMVTSFPMSGYNGVAAGDLAIDLDGNNGYEYGIKTQDMPVDQSNDLQAIRKDPDWEFGTHEFPLYMKASYGSFIGYAQIYYKYYPGLEINPLPPPVGEQPFRDTWILEGKVKRSDFISHPPQDGDTIKLHWSMYCGNDYIDLTGDFDATPIPEPATLSLLGLGLLGLLGARKKKV